MCYLKLLCKASKKTMNNLNYSIRPVTYEDKNSVSSIYNYYIENSFAAYPENYLEMDFFQRFKDMASGYPFYVVELQDKSIVGFAFLHSYSPIGCFNRVAEITYFILPEYTRKGIGKNLLDTLVNKARENRIEILLANISSLNHMSINFHEKNGFKECGRFERIGKKFGTDFDVVWMQKFI